MQLLEGVEDAIHDRGGFLLGVDEQRHRQGGVDGPALGFEPAGTGAVAHALAGLGQVFLVVGEDGEQQASRGVRVPDGQGDAHAAGDTDVGDDFEATRVQVLGEVDEQTVRFASQDRPRVHAFSGMPLCDFDEVHEHPRARVSQAIAVDLLAVKRADEGEVAAHGAQNLGQGVCAALGRQDTEVVDDAPVRRLRKSHGHDERFAGEAHGLRGTENDEGFGRRRVKERGQAWLLGAHRLQGVTNAPGVAVG